MMKITFFARYVFKMKKNLLFLVASMFVILIPSHTVNGGWARIFQPGHGAIYSLAVSGSSIFAGTGGGGVFLSTNNGISWTAVNSGLTSTFVYPLAVSGNSIFAGTAGSGVFLSTNKGTSWTAVNNGLPTNAIVYSLAVNDSNIFAGTAGRGVFLSTNNGTSWTAVNNGLPTNAAVYSLAVNDSNIFAGTAGGGVFLSTNNGSSWIVVKSGLPANTDIFTLAVSGSTIFAGTNGRGVFLSTNNGTNWTAVNNGLTDSTVWSLAVDRCLIFAGTQGKGIFLSADNGTTWKAINEALTDTIVRSLAVNDSTIFAGAAGGSVWRRPLSEMVAFTNLNMQHEYVMPFNYYNFTWGAVQNAAGFDIYGNNVLFHHASGLPLSFRGETLRIIDTIEKGTGKPIKSGDTVTYYLVARSFSYNNQIIGVSNFVRMPFDIAIGAQPLKAFPKKYGIHISGSLIDCSSLRGPVQISLYSLNGAKVWAKQGVSVKTIVPAHLRSGAYTVEVTGEFGKTSRVMIRE